MTDPCFCPTSYWLRLFSSRYNYAVVITVPVQQDNHGKQSRPVNWRNNGITDYIKVAMKELHLYGTLYTDKRWKANYSCSHILYSDDAILAVHI